MLEYHLLTGCALFTRRVKAEERVDRRFEVPTLPVTNQHDGTDEKIINDSKVRSKIRKVRVGRVNN